MRKWEIGIHKQKVIIQGILDKWIALLFAGDPIPNPSTKWEYETATGFAIFVTCLREGGLVF